MKDTKWLNKANEINEEVKELERFIIGASHSRRTQLISHNVFFDRILEYNMPTEVKNEVLDVLLRRKEYLLNELNEIRKL